MQYKQVEIIGKTFDVIPTEDGCCDGCYFLNKSTCPPKALRQCVMTGNILRLVEHTKDNVVKEIKD